MLLIHTLHGFREYLSHQQSREIKPRLYRLYNTLVIDDDDRGEDYIDHVDGCWIDVDRKLLTDEIDVHHAESLIIQSFHLPESGTYNMFRDRLVHLLVGYSGRKCELDVMCSHEEHIQMVMFLYFNLYSLPDSVPVPGGIRFEWNWLYKY